MVADGIHIIELHTQVLFLPGGSVREWSRVVTKEIETAAKAKAPPFRSYARWPSRATGRLNRSIRGRLNRTTVRILRADVYVRVPYAKYVLGGTANNGTGLIYSTAGYGARGEISDHMEFLVDLAMQGENYGQEQLRDDPDIPDDWWMRTPWGPKLVVSGQRKNPFLRDGYNEVARMHAALKPMR